MGVPLSSALPHGIWHDEQGRGRPHERGGKPMNTTYFSKARFAVAGLLLLGTVSPVRADNTDPGMTAAMHGSQIFHVVRFQIDGAHNDEGGLVNWHGMGSNGGATDKLTVKTETEKPK